MHIAPFHTEQRFIRSVGSRIDHCRRSHKGSDGRRKQINIAPAFKAYVAFEKAGVVFITFFFVLLLFRKADRDLRTDIRFAFNGDPRVVKLSGVFDYRKPQTRTGYIF